MSQAELTAVEQRADRIYGVLSGSGEARDAVRYLMKEEMNSSYLACMKSKGEAVDAKFVRIYTVDPPNGTSVRWMGALGRKPSAAALGSPEARRLESQPVPQLSATFTAAARACEKERKPLRPSFGQDDGEPEKPSAEWTRYLTKEAQVLDADTSCRRSKQNLGLAQLADPLARFESKHAKDLAEVDGQWAQLVERAKAAGFRP